MYKRQGAATALMESTLAQAYKTKINGEYIGGPALFIERGLKIKPYAVLFALATILSLIHILIVLDTPQVMDLRSGGDPGTRS